VPDSDTDIGEHSFELPPGRAGDGGSDPPGVVNGSREPDACMPRAAAAEARVCIFGCNGGVARDLAMAPEYFVPFLLPIPVCRLMILEKHASGACERVWSRLEGRWRLHGRQCRACEANAGCTAACEPAHEGTHSARSGTPRPWKVARSCRIRSGLLRRRAGKGGRAAQASSQADPWPRALSSKNPWDLGVHMLEVIQRTGAYLRAQ